MALSKSTAKLTSLRDRKSNGYPLLIVDLIGSAEPFEIVTGRVSTTGLTRWNSGSCRRLKLAHPQTLFDWFFSHQYFLYLSGTYQRSQNC